MSTTEVPVGFAETKLSELTRQQKLDLYVLIDALECTFACLADEYEPLHFVGSPDSPSDWSRIEWSLWDANVTFQTKDGEVSASSLLCDLWPEDGTGEDVPREDRPECRLAEARSDVLRSRIFTALAGSGEILAKKAAACAGNAERQLSSLGREFARGGDIERYYSDPAYRASLPCSECGGVGGCEHFPAEVWIVEEGDDA